MIPTAEIATLRLFNGLTPEASSQIGAAFQPRTFQAGNIILRQDELSHAMHLHPQLALNIMRELS